MRLRRRLARARRHVRPRADDGMQLVEIGMALLVMSVAVIGVMGSMGSSLTLVGQSKQRSAAMAIAQERLERAHNVPYARLSLFETPAHSTDASSPDYLVSNDNQTYTIDDATHEPLIVDTANGALKHIDDPVKVGATELNVYQYVTWHDDPQVTSTMCPGGGSTYCDYKRVVVVVTWKYPVSHGTAHVITSATFIGPGGVIVPASSASPTPSPAPTATPAASATPTPPPACGTMQLLSGTGAQQGYTNSTGLQVQLTSLGGCSSAALSNDGTSFTNVASSFPATVTWMLAGGDGMKTVYARFTTGDGVNSTTNSAITLDQTKPTTPGNVRKSTCAISGSTRSATFTWNASTDTNLIGYRVYKQVNSGAFTQLTTTTSLSASDGSSKGDNVTYYATAYDAAGNESVPSNNLAYVKNSC